MSQVEKLHETMLLYQKLMRAHQGTESGAHYKKLYRSTKRLYYKERERVGREVRKSVNETTKDTDKA